MAYGDEKLPQFDALRRRLQGQFQQKRQQAGDAIQRRYAAQGMLNSGAYNKSVEENERQFTKDEADATAQLDFAEMNEQQRRKEVVEGREYQTKEREGAQQFNRELFDRDMEFKKAVFGDESKARWAQLDLAFKEFDESKAANKINAAIGLAGAEMDAPDFDHYLNQYERLRSGPGQPAPQGGPGPNPYQVGSKDWIAYRQKYGR